LLLSFHVLYLPLHATFFQALSSSKGFVEAVTTLDVLADVFLVADLALRCAFFAWVGASNVREML